MIIFYTSEEGGEGKKYNTTRKEFKCFMEHLLKTIPKYKHPYFVYSGSIYIPKANLLYDLALLCNLDYYWLWNRIMPPQTITYLRRL